MATSVMASSRVGKAIMISVKRISSVSVQPPKKPAIDADDHAERHRQQIGQHADHQADPRAVQHAAEQVAAVGIGAQRKTPAAAQQRARDGLAVRRQPIPKLFGRVVRREVRGEDRGQKR